MAKSMTAFARSRTNGEAGELVWEIRSVNHRYLETSVRLPEEFRALEPVVREQVSKRLGRGKVDCNLKFTPAPGTSDGLTVNGELADQVLAAAHELMGKLHSSPLPTVMDLMRWPGVLVQAEQDTESLQKAATDLLRDALDELVETRAREGARLAEIIGERLEGMRVQVDRARERMPEVIRLVRERLRARLAEMVENVDTDRLEQEMAMLAQRLDVDEEMDRLNTHLDEVARVLGKKEPIGRRLDFLMQELNREANTLGSKSNDSETTAVSVEMKVLIEQMREQVQNLE